MPQGNAKFPVSPIFRFNFRYNGYCMITWLLLLPAAALFMAINVIVGCYVAIRFGYGPPDWKTALNLVVRVTTLQDRLNAGRDWLDKKAPWADKFLNRLHVPRPIVIVEVPEEEENKEDETEQNNESNEVSSETSKAGEAGEANNEVADGTDGANEADKDADKDKVEKADDKAANAPTASAPTVNTPTVNAQTEGIVDVAPAAATPAEKPQA